MHTSRITSYFEKPRSIAQRQLKDCGLHSCKPGFQLPGRRSTALPHRYTRSKNRRLRALQRHTVQCKKLQPCSHLQPMVLSSKTSSAPLAVRTRVLWPLIASRQCCNACLMSRSGTSWRDIQAAKGTAEGSATYIHSFTASEIDALPTVRRDCGGRDGGREAGSKEFEMYTW